MSAHNANPKPTRTLADFGGSKPATDGGTRERPGSDTDADSDAHPRVRRAPAQSTLADPEQVGVTLSMTHLPDERPELIGEGTESTFLTRTNVSGQERVNTHVCPLCGRKRRTWPEDEPSEHFGRADHDWAALERARATIQGAYDTE